MSGQSLRDQIAARRAAAQNTNTASRTAAARSSAQAASARGSSSTNMEVMEEKTIPGQIKKAGKTGKLDIAALNLDRIPSELYTSLLGIPADELSNPPPPPLTSSKSDVRGMSSSFSVQLALAEKRDQEGVFGKSKAREEWVEPEAELISFNAERNGIDRVDREIGAFGGLKSINLSNNRISVLPDSFADLLRLTSINLSHNAFTSLPPAVILLPNLEVLDLSHNALTTLDLSSPIEPSDEGMAYGAGFLTTSFSRQSKKSKEIWPVLRSLNLASNRLTIKELNGLKVAGGFKGMRALNLEDNALEGELDLVSIGLDKEGMPQLASLVLKGNRSLLGSKGEIAEGCKVDLEGTGTGTGQRGTGSGSAGAAQETEKPAEARSAAASADIPQPDLRLVYRTCPAATFDSLPLEVDLDLYLPPEASSSGKGHPLVIWFHGGGLLQGNKENLPPHFRRLPRTPFGNFESVAVISPNYRLAPQVPIIDILSDVTTLITFIRTKLNERLAKEGKGDNRIDTERICLGGGSAGGYLAMIAGMRMPLGLTDEEVGGYRGEKGIKCIAPFYPITDLTDKFWSTETNPVPWMNRSIPHAEAKPHLDVRAAPVCTAISGGPRSILYPYMLQHALFPSLLFLTQRSIGSGLDGFRPSPESLSITTRLQYFVDKGAKYPPTYFAFGGKDDKVQPMKKTLGLLEESKGDVEYDYRENRDHQFDEDPRETCDAFREWLGRTLL